MKTRFQLSLNRIKADDALINKTEAYLRDKLTESQDPKIVKFPKPRLVFIRNLASIVCIVCILVGGCTGEYAFYTSPVSYISLDINPSIELGVNVFNKVVTAEGYNSDGKTVLTGLNVMGDDVAAAVRAVISSAADNGFVESDGSTVISVTSETDDTKIAQKLESEAEAGVNEALEVEGRTAAVVKGNVRLSLRDEARELSITPGKLNLIKKLQAVNSLATLDQYRDAKVTEILAATQEYADSNTNSSKEGTVINSQKKDALSSRKESTEINKEQNTTKNIDESTISSKDKSAVSSKDNSAVKSKDGSTAGSKDNNAENSKGESAASSKDKNTGKNKDESVVNSKDNGNKKSKDVNNPSNKIGQVVNEEAALTNKHEAAKSNSTKNPASNMTTVREWIEKNSTKNAAKFSKK